MHEAWSTNGAKREYKLCSSDGCNSKVQRNGVCRRHGAYHNPLDESTAFDLSHRSAHDETTATLPNHNVALEKKRGQDPPSVIVCQVIDYVEV